MAIITQTFSKKGQAMLQKLFLVAMTLFFVACGSKSTMQQVNDTANKQACYACDDPKAYEAKIRGLLYISDIGIRCCADKRTLDKSIGVKKIYIHSISDLDEEQKLFYANGKSLIINEKFNAVFFTFLKQELEARGMLIVKGINNSPYVLRLDLSLLTFSANLDATGLHSSISGRLTLKDINHDKDIIVRTKQDIMGFSDTKEISFYTYLLLRQLANKTASIISAL